MMNERRVRDFGWHPDDLFSARPLGFGLHHKGPANTPEGGQVALANDVLREITNCTAVGGEGGPLLA